VCALWVCGINDQSYLPLSLTHTQRATALNRFLEHYHGRNANTVGLQERTELLHCTRSLQRPSGQVSGSEPLEHEQQTWSDTPVTAQAATDSVAPGMRSMICKHMSDNSSASVPTPCRC
jgi:hypothetical protein